MDIYAVKKGTGHLGFVPLNLRNGTRAFLVRVGIETAWAGVGSGNQHESGRIG